MGLNEVLPTFSSHGMVGTLENTAPTISRWGVGVPGNMNNGNGPSSKRV